MLDPRLATAIADSFGVTVDKITPDSSAEDLPGWDSVGHITLILNLEEATTVFFFTRGTTTVRRCSTKTRTVTITTREIASWAHIGKERGAGFTGTKPLLAVANS